MKRSHVLAFALLLAGLLSGCLENPLCDDDYYYEPAPPAEDPPGPPNVFGSALMTSGAFDTRHGGTMTVLVRASNAGGVETAYDIQGRIVVNNGSTQIGSANIYLGDLNADQWTETSVEVSVSSYPGSGATMTLELTWWDLYDTMYQRQVNGSVLFKTPA